MKEITLQTPSFTGTIYVGDDAIEKRLPMLTQGQKNFVVTDSNVFALYGDFFNTYFQDTETFVFPRKHAKKEIF